MNLDDRLSAAFTDLERRVTQQLETRPNATEIQPETRPDRSWRPMFVPVAVAVMALLLIGAPLWLLRATSDPDPTVPVATDPTPSVTVTVPTPTTAVPATTTPPTTVPVTTVPPATVPATTVPATTIPTPSVLLSIDAIWNGVEETITLFEDGRLVAGPSEIQVDVPSLDTFWIDLQAALEVVDFGAPGYDQAILVSLPVAESEDPPNLAQLFVDDGGELRPILNQAFGVYNVTPLVFAGDGTVEYQEDGWTACLRAEMPQEANRQFVTLSLDESGMLVETARRDSGDVQACDLLAG